MIFIQIFLVIMLNYCIVRCFEALATNPKRLRPDVEKV